MLFSCVSLFSAEILYFPSAHRMSDDSPSLTHTQADQREIYNKIKEIVQSGRAIKIVAEELFYRPGYRGFFVPLYKPIQDGKHYQLWKPSGFSEESKKVTFVKQSIVKTIDDILRKEGAISALIAESASFDNAHPVAHDYIKDLVQSVSIDDGAPMNTAEILINVIQNETNKLMTYFFKSTNDKKEAFLKRFKVNYVLDMYNNISQTSFSNYNYGVLEGLFKKSLFLTDDHLYAYTKVVMYDREAEVIQVLAKSISENPDALHILIFGANHNLSKFFKDKPNVSFSIANGFREFYDPGYTIFEANEEHDKRFLRTFVNPF